MRSQELVACPQVEQRRETLRRSLRRRARELLLEQELAQLREGRTSRRERAETVLLVSRQGAVEDGEALAPDANCAGLASGAALALAVFLGGASSVEVPSKVKATVIGNEPSDKTKPSRLWPADHAGVVGTLTFP